MIQQAGQGEIMIMMTKKMTHTFKQLCLRHLCVFKKNIIIFTDNMPPFIYDIDQLNDRAHPVNSDNHHFPLQQQQETAPPIQQQQPAPIPQEEPALPLHQ
jgi:hypothetical protein